MGEVASLNTQLAQMIPGDTYKAGFIKGKLLFYHDRHMKSWKTSSPPSTNHVSKLILQKTETTSYIDSEILTLVS